MKTKLIKIPESQHTRLKALAARKKMTLEELAAVAVAFFLMKQKEIGGVIFEGRKPQ